MARRLIIALEDKTSFDGWVEDDFEWEFADGAAILSATVTDPPEPTDPPAEAPNPDVDNGLVEVTPEPTSEPTPITPEVDQGHRPGAGGTPDQTVPTLPQKPDQELVEATPPPPEGNPDLTPEVDQGTDQELVEATPPVEEVPNPDVDNGLLEETPTPVEEDPWLYAVEQVNQANRVVDFTAKKGLVLTEDQAIDEGFMFRCAQISSLDGPVRREFSKTFPAYAGALNCTLEDQYGDGIPANNGTMKKTVAFAVAPQSVVADPVSKSKKG